MAKFFAKAFHEVLLPSLENLATKDELKGLATKDDLKNLATKDEVRHLRADMNGRFDEVEVSLQKLLKSRDIHELRIKNLEVKAFGI